MCRALAGRLRGFVVVEDAHRRRLEIVELPALRGPRIGGHRSTGDDQRHRDEDEHDAHRGSSPNVRLRHETRTTVSELTGIRIAAIRGLITPVIASVAPIRL